MSYHQNMSFNAQCKDDDNCKCPSTPTWVVLAIAVLPAVLPVIFEKIGDALIAFWGLNEDNLKGEEAHKEDKTDVK